jgi:DNA modification methylase
MANVLLVQGDSRQIALADQSVHCVITSPPYWSLRDYGTATWEGGDAECDHTKRPPNLPRDPTSTLHSRASNQNHKREPSYGTTCGKCGATRIDQQIGLEALHDCLGWAQTQEPYIAYDAEQAPYIAWRPSGKAGCGACWVCHMREVFREVWRVLRKDGTLWLNCGDSHWSNPAKGGSGTYNGRNGYGEGYNRRHRSPAVPNLKPKSLCGMPWRLALALQADGWILRAEIIWEKPSCMPQSMTDRPTRSHEQLFLFSKQGRYYFDNEAIREDANDWGPKNRTAAKYNTNGFRPSGQPPPHGLDNGDWQASCRNARTVWTIPSEPLSFAHFAAFPTALVERCLKAGTSQQGVCSRCSAPWVPVVEVGELIPDAPGYKARGRISEDPERIMAGMGWRKGKPTPTHHYKKTTTGWRPTCTHDAPVAPAIVFDPFVGAGTVPLTARALGRHGLGADLSWTYLHDIARQRLGLADLAAWQGDPDPPRPITYTDLPLFTQP